MSVVCGLVSARVRMSAGGKKGLEVIRDKSRHNMDVTIAEMSFVQIPESC